MSWLRTTSLTLARNLSRSLDPRHDYEPSACYSSFVKHWQQANDVILRSQPSHLHDDVLGVVNHLEQLSTLLVLEAKAREISPASSLTPAACLEYLLSENLLDKLYEWAVCTGKYENAVRLEQLKLFGSLITHYSTQVIAAEPFLRPLLKLLIGFRNELPPPNLESQLVTMLNQLCVALTQHMKFIDLFFLTTHTRNGAQAEFIIVRLLLSSVHREGATGAAARDALLLCAKMSAHSPQLAECMLTGNTCVVLATGLSGLYSLLPRTLHERVHRLTPDDVNHVHKLTLFIDSLEFCNAVAQVAHASIKKQLLDLLYQGFLVPVMGPALLQSGAAEQAAATAYAELCVRCVTRRGLARPVLGFLLQHVYDGVKLIDVLLARMRGESQLSLVSLVLMETLLDLNCEDVMLELVLKYLLQGQHVMTPHRAGLACPEPYRRAAEAFLTLTPRCCARPLDRTRERAKELAASGCRVLDLRRDDDSRTGYKGDIALTHLANDPNYGNPNETLIGNYHAYLCDARFTIAARTLACAKWTSRYDHPHTAAAATTAGKKETNNNTKDSQHDNVTKEDSLTSVATSGYETLKTSDTSEKEPPSLTSLTEVDENKMASKDDEKEHDSLTSMGESSGYDSFLYKAEEGEETEGFAEEAFRRSTRKTDNVNEYDGDVPLVRNWRASPETVIGPLLNCLLKKVAALLEADVVTNSRVTSVVTKLASYPAPLLMSLLLCPNFVLQPNVPSLFQILSTLKEEVDRLTEGLENANELVDKARLFLLQRELSLAKSRSHAADDGSSGPDSPTRHRAEPETPERRTEPKRRSLSSSLSHMFTRRLSSSPSQQTSITMQNTHYTSSPVRGERVEFTQESYWNQSITLRSIVNAVLLGEWVTELAALCEEHALRMAADDASSVRAVRL